MRIYNRQNKIWTIPLYDIGTLISGFYIGYNEGKGIDTSQTVDYLTKYGPTILAVSMTPLILKATNMFGRWTNRKMLRDLCNENFEVTIKGKTKQYKDLDEDKKQELTNKMLENVNDLESKLQNPQYLKPTLIAGTRTAIETMIGYAAGRIYSQIN
jgi:hypothetical protein